MSPKSNTRQLGYFLRINSIYVAARSSPPFGLALQPQDSSAPFVELVNSTASCRAGSAATASCAGICSTITCTAPDDELTIDTSACSAGNDIIKINKVIGKIIILCISA